MEPLERSNILQEGQLQVINIEIKFFREIEFLFHDFFLCAFFRKKDKGTFTNDVSILRGRGFVFTNFLFLLTQKKIRF